MKDNYAFRLIFLCTAVYFVSYLSRINLAAVMVDLVHSGFTARQTAALAGAVICFAIIKQWGNFRRNDA